MKITAGKIHWVEGLLEPEVRYLPTWAHYSVQLGSDSVGAVAARTGDGRRKLMETFLYIETDEGITGVAGPIIYGNSTAAIILQDYAPVFVGKDPMNNERLWDIMHRKHPISAGENHFTRWKFKQLLDRTDIRIFQTDPMWCDGMPRRIEPCK